MENNNNNSRYSGSFGGLLWRMFLSTIVAIVTVGIAVPWAITIVYRWIVDHVKINNMATRYTGAGKQLFGAWIFTWIIMLVAVMLIAVTALSFVSMDNIAAFGEEAFKNLAPQSIATILVVIFGSVIGVGLMLAWFGLKVNRIFIAHTHYEGGDGKAVSMFDAPFDQFLGQNILYVLRSVVTIFIGLPWALACYIEWWSAKTTLDGRQLQYKAQPSFLKKWMPYWIGSVVLSIVSGFVADSGNFNNFSFLKSVVDIIEFLWQALVLTFVLRQVIARTSHSEIALA